VPSDIKNFLVPSSVADLGCFIPDPGSGSLDVSFRILGVKRHRIPDPTVHKKRDEKQKQPFLAPYGFKKKFYL
jgi:hypothetical protein